MNNISNSIAYPKYNPTYTGIEWLLNTHQTYYLILILFVAFYVNGDFTRHTFYSCLLCGVSRKNAFWAKIIAVFSGIVPLMLASSLTGTVLWSIHAGFGMDFGKEAVFLVTKAFARQILSSLMLVSNTVFFSVIAKSKIGAFSCSFGSLYVLAVLRGNIERIIMIPAFRKIILFLLSMFYINLGTFLASILLKLLAARFIFERCDLK